MTLIEHIREVQAVIPPERLLIHRSTDGWGPLCEFLGKPVPTTPYPHVNESRHVKQILALIRILNLAPWIVAIGIVLGLVLWLT